MLLAQVHSEYQQQDRKSLYANPGPHQTCANYFVQISAPAHGKQTYHHDQDGREQGKNNNYVK